MSILSDEIRGILEGKEHCAVNKVSPILRGFIECVMKYTKSLRNNRSHGRHSLLVSRDGFDN